MAGAAPSSSVPVSEDSVEVSDVILRALDLARAVHSDVADAGTTKDSENDEENIDFTETDVVK